MQNQHTESDLVDYALDELVADVNVTPQEVFDNFAAEGYRQQNLQKKAEVLVGELNDLDHDAPLSRALREQLRALQKRIESILGDEA
ncbi:hypothetical protein Q9Q99_09650 [Curtobacterium flaccumfaciens]|nr:hypothetical protein Q9Q99_09650 [Curtobacterium flaccumfaciens]